MDDRDLTQKFNARLAGWLLRVYGLVYLAFVLVNGFAPQWVEWKPIGGVNLAVWWGLGLIGLAFLLSFVYGWFCKPDVARFDSLGRFHGSSDTPEE